MANSTLLLVLPLPLLFLFFLLLLTKGSRRAQRHLQLPPGPKPLPIIGNLHQLGSLPHRSLWRLSRCHGPAVMSLKLGSVPAVVVSSAEAAREVLKTRDLDFCSRPRLCAPTKYSYDNSDISFAPYGEHWRQLRKLSTLELFSVQRVRSFQLVRNEEIDSMIGAISSSADSGAVNLSEMILSLANDIVCRVAFGMKYHRDQEGLVGGLRQVLEENQELLTSLFMQDYFPFFGYWIDKLTGLSARLQKNAKALDSIYDKVIQAHLDTKYETPKPHEDIIDILLEAMNGSNLTMDIIKAVIADIFIAGSETASVTIIWAMSELVRNPKLMRKAQEEIRNIVGSAADGRLKESHLQHFQYLKAVIKETFRLHTPVPLLLPRESLRHSMIAGYDIPANTRVYINAWGIGRDPQSWERHEEFVPDRFIGSSIDFQGQDFEFIPFGSGRRICPGMNFGVINVELILASLLYYFDWELPKGMKEEHINLEEAPGLTVHKKTPLLLVPRKVVAK